jgi:peptidoglycan/xylan/chitin deacetylase (PgdA/CDA1 family)
MSKKEVVARVVGRPVLSRFRNDASALRILAYHRVVPRPWDDFAFDEEIISATPEVFEAQMRFVQKNFDVVSFSDLDKCEREGRDWPKRALIVTFDDGYRDNYTEAWPILRDLNLPATIFLTTGHIGESKLFWWDAIAWYFKSTTRPLVLLSDISSELFSLRTIQDKRKAIDAVLNWVKAVSEEERQNFLSFLPTLLDVISPSDIASRMHLSWDEVREMVKTGIEFGSHTVTHPILSRVDADRLRIETYESKAHIEREIGQRVLSFAYPAGTQKRRDEAARTMVENCDYRFAVAYDQRVERKPDRYALPRIHVDREQSLSLFRANLLFPALMLR